MTENSKSGDALNIYGQPFEHADAWLAGTYQSLARLHRLIGQALSRCEAPDTEVIEAICDMDFICGDGEGYTLRVLLLDSFAALESMATPYTDSTASDCPRDAVRPWDL